MMMVVVVIVGAARRREAEPQLVVVMMMVVGRIEGRVVGVGVAGGLWVTRRRLRLDAGQQRRVAQVRALAHHVSVRTIRRRLQICNI